MFSCIDCTRQHGSLFCGLREGLRSFYACASRTSHCLVFTVCTCMMCNTKTYTTKYHIHKAKKTQKFVKFTLCFHSRFFKTNS